MVCFRIKSKYWGSSQKKPDMMIRGEYLAGKRPKIYTAAEWVSPVRYPFVIVYAVIYIISLLYFTIKFIIHLFPCRYNDLLRSLSELGVLQLYANNPDECGQLRVVVRPKAATKVNTALTSAFRSRLFAYGR